MQKYILGLLLTLSLLVVSTSAQDLTNTYTAPDGSYTFDHPRGFSFAERGTPRALRARGIINGETIQMAVFGPNNDFFLERVEINASAIVQLQLIDVLVPFILLASPDFSSLIDQDIQAPRFDSRQGLLQIMPSGDDENWIYGVEFDDGNFGVMMFTLAAGGDRDEQAEIFESIVATFNSGDPNAVTTTSTTSDEIVLKDYDGEWSRAVEELQSFGLIASSGGTIVFVENRAFMEGEGNNFIALALVAPRTDFVMAATMDFSSESASDLETCSLLSRTNSNSAGDGSEIFLQVGIDSNGDLFFVDRPAESSQIAFSLEELSLNLSSEHHILYIVQEDRLTIFVDGELIFSNMRVEEREGFFGVALLGEDPDSRCEATNVWVYASPPFTPGLCTANAPSGAVNKRAGAGTNFDRVGQLTAEPLEVTAQTDGADGFTWYQLEDDSFVREDVIAIAGDCSGLPEADTK